MKVLYRPQRGGYDESMSLLTEYSSLFDMFCNLATESDYSFCAADVSICFYGFDGRNGWESYAVCVRWYSG